MRVRIFLHQSLFVNVHNDFVHNWNIQFNADFQKGKRGKNIAEIPLKVVKVSEKWLKDT